jgi:hypothetical protein
VVNQDVFAAVVVMVILTTAMTPPALKWSLSRERQAPAARRRATN